MKCESEPSFHHMLKLFLPTGEHVSGMRHNFSRQLRRSAEAEIENLTENLFRIKAYVTIGNSCSSHAVRQIRIPPDKTTNQKIR